MNILFINTYDDPSDGGGAEVTIWTLMRALASQGHNCSILATHGGKGLQRSERDGIGIWRAGIKNVYWPTREKQSSPLSKLIWHAFDSYNPLMQATLREVIQTERPDVVSVHNLPGWSASTWTTLKEYGVPFVQVLHDQYAICAKGTMFREGNCVRQCTSCALLRLPHRGVSNKPSAVVGVSRFILEHHEKHGYFLNVPKKRVINNTRNGALLNVNAPSEQHTGVRFGFIGRLDPSKGVEMLLDCFARIDRPTAELWIAGSGSSGYVNKLKERSRDLRVSFLGQVKQSDFFPKVDVVVVPSIWNDTLPGVVFEGLAYGKPVIASRRGGIPEMIEHGKNGLLFDPDRPDELTGLLQSFTTDLEQRAAIGQAARISAQKYLDTESWVRQYLDLYRELTQNRPEWQPA
ncbi:glycosyltransferase family 4 protein [Pseudoxanthomonas suwonensis]|uniref:glycosyltransferase family 4 protein n=1 Tax=Pseudoxanthomonas suwonensis TaxID=314722 RepID=UPI00056370E2|nr:glycosyltransferase family 4 protein [Pseudoxanthomonas suwonensis]